KPEKLKPVSYPDKLPPIQITLAPRKKPDKKLVGVDVFLDWQGNPEALGKTLENVAGPEFSLTMITNRGTKVYPGGMPETFCVDHWRCRFQSSGTAKTVSDEDVLALLTRLVRSGYPPVKTEGLFTFDGKPGFSLGQGQ
ncbi:MAG: NADP-dependent isocitrate dehydrogenase, partial [Candidatus Thermoplasmatota archaeon]|nr:NADP-dependent isocitrate dehydrogenase [Candidatus Thermoplasmatota archaeon]